MSRTYCYHCAGRLEQKDERSWWCEQCQQMYFENAATGAEAMIINANNEVLVAKRNLDPFKGKPDFPGGFVDFNETVEDALYRELEEELGIQKSNLGELTYIGSYFAPYPWGKDVVRVAVMCFLVRLDEGVIVTPRDEVCDVRFVAFDNLSQEDFPEAHGRSEILTRANKMVTQL